MAIFSIGLLLALAAGAVRAESGRRPNIILILADDLGWSDLGCYGNEMFQTPHLDQFAQEGVRFTQAYAAAPICSASRAGVLTGKSPARLGFEFVTKNEPGLQPVNAPLQAPPFTLDLPLEERTIAEVLGDAGYQTVFFGKWHLNRHYQRYLGWSPTHGPKSQGFEVAEEDFGAHPYSYWSDKAERQLRDLPDGEFLADTMNQRAIGFLRKPHNRPFFLMVSHFYVHTPVHTRVRWLHDQCLDRIPVDHPRREALANYGAMVATLDKLAGELLSAVDDAGLRTSTLVVFTSDNGGHPEYAGNTPLRGSKWNLYEGGIRVPFLVRWPGIVPAALTSDAVVCGSDLLPTFAEVADARTPADLDGQSFFPIEARGHPRSLIWHFPYYHPEHGFDDAPTSIGINDGVTSQTRPHSAIRSGDFKLLHYYESDRDELYDLTSDISEQHDLVISQPEVASRLRNALDAALQQRRARMPVANPQWNSP